MMAAIITTFAVVLVLGQPVVKHQSSPGEHQQIAYYYPQQAVGAPTQPSPKIENNNTNEESGEGPNWSNWALVVVGVVGIFVAVKTLRKIERQTAATEKAAEAAKISARAILDSERAWLIATAYVPRNMTKHETIWISPQRVGTDQISYGFGFDWSIKNCGKSPAFITRIGARFHPISSLSDLRKEPDIEVSNLYQPTAHFPHGLSISPDETINRFTFSKEEQPIGDERKKVMDGTLVWIGYGIVEYRTVFTSEQIHSTRFCYVWKPGQLTDSWERSDLPEEYTKQT